MKTFLTVLFITIPCYFTFAQSNMEKGDEYFNKRFDNIQNGKADPSNIDQAIDYYLKAENSTDKYKALLQSYEFKGSWTNISDDEARKTYNEGIELGKKVKGDYPNNAGIWYWYIANLSRWGDQVPIVEAADEGILDEVKEVTEKVIALDPSYHEAGAMRLLGGVHLKAPSIPFVLTWPSEERAQELLNRAYDIAPENAANTYYYALVLVNEDKHDKAKTILEDLMDRKPRPEFILVDRKFIDKGKELYAEEFE